MVRDQIDATRSFLSSIKTLKQKVADGYRELLEPELRNGEVLPDAALSLDLIGRSVERRLERLLDVNEQ